MQYIKFKDGTTIEICDVILGSDKITTIILDNQDYANIKELFSNSENIEYFDVLNEGIVVGTYKGFKELHSINITPSIDVDGNPIEKFIVNIKDIDYESKVDILQRKYEKIDETINPTIDFDKMSLDELIKYKVSEFGKQCTQNIYAGADVELSTGLQHFSFTDQDQVNIKAGFDIAYSTGMSVPYHADKEYCTIFKASDMLKIYGAEQTLITNETSYCNMLNNYVRNLTDTESIKAIEYGMKLPAELADKMENILAHSQTILVTLLQNATPDIQHTDVVSNK